MSSPFTSFPLELLDSILDILSIKDLVVLCESNRNYIPVLESRLFSPSNLAETLGAACQQGFNALISRTIEMGADPSIGAIRNVSDRTYTASTLVLAVRSKNDISFRLLLSLGATMHEFGPAQTSKLCRRLLTRSDNPELLTHYIRSRPGSAFALSEAILGGASLDAIRLLLTQGSDPNRLTKMANSWTSPLSAATNKNNMAVFNLLLENGANINGPDLIETGGAKWPPLHIPIFAAAKTMARDGTSFMQRCLDLGVSVNTEWSEVGTETGLAGVWSVRYITPVYVFIKTFPGRVLTDHEYRTMCDGIDFMIANGAVF